MSTIQRLRADLIRYATERTEAVVSRFLPDFELPGFMAGHRTAAFNSSDLIYLVANLQALGVETLCGWPVHSIFHKLLKQVDGPKTETFFSYRIAETILGLGGFAALKEFTEPELENLRQAVDSSHIYDAQTDSLGGYPRNYWAVLARCEFARERLGLLKDSALLDRSVAKVREILSENPAGFFDDSTDGSGRYDSYSADMALFTEPYWHLIGEDVIQPNLRTHVRMVEQIAMENGSSVAWGRSIGALSVCLTLELSCISLHHGIAADPARSVALAKNAFVKFQDWIQDDLIAAHRDGMTEGYRGTHRVLQMTLDCLSKLCSAAQSLTGAAEVAGESGPLYPMADTFISFDSQNAGLWMFRNEHLVFQLPLVGGWNSDYVAWLHSPGLFENAVESPMACGVPRIGWKRAEFYPSGRPSAVSKRANGLQAEFDQFMRGSGDQNAPEFKGRRRVDFAIEGNTVVVKEAWEFAEQPDAICFHIAEAREPLHLSIETGAPHHCSVVAVEGMPEWRSPWGELRKLHQVDFKPNCKIEFTWRLRKA